jgi:hypothetical protein
MSFASFKLLSKSGIPNRFRNFDIGPTPQSSALGNGRLALVGNTGGVWVSDNGINFQATSTPAFSPKAITYGNGKFVAVGRLSTSQAGLYSSDGINWSVSLLPAITNWHSIAYGNGMFIATPYTLTPESGPGNIIALSSDGINWTSLTLEIDSLRDNQIIYADGKFVISGGAINGGSFYSTDGINWNQCLVTGGGINLERVAYGSGRFVAVDNSSSAVNKIAYSLDGINWSIIEVFQNSYKGFNIAYEKINGVGYFFITTRDRATSDNSSFGAYSTDGLNWTSVSLPYTTSWSFVYGAFGKFSFTSDSSQGGYPFGSITQSI